jgi:hypothetical protein
VTRDVQAWVQADQYRDLREHEMTTSTELLAQCAIGMHPWVARVNDHGDHYEICLACGCYSDPGESRLG